MLAVQSDEDYLALIGPKSRNMIRKAERRGFVYGQFDYNHFLDEMYEVNTSLPERGGRPMTASYTTRPEPVVDSLDCLRHRRIWVGGFKEGRLRAYCQLVIVNDLAVVNRILGHGGYLKDGVMNGLVYEIVRFCRSTSAQWINYLTLDSSPPGLAAFKRRVGFRTMEVTFR